MDHRLLSSWHIRLAAAAMIATTGLALLPMGAAAGIDVAFCSWNSSDRRVDVRMIGNVTAILARTPEGRITVNGDWCGDIATVSGTNSINVQGDEKQQTLVINLANGGFRPGRTQEEGESDEVEIVMALYGDQDTLAIAGTSAAENIALGQGNTGDIRINLNAGESSGVDLDVIAVQVEAVSVDAKGGNDKVRATGILGSGPNPLGVKLYAYGGPGADDLRGGSVGDYLHAGTGSDVVRGNGGYDEIDLRDNVNGNDTGYKGAGGALCPKDPNDTCS